MDSKKFVCTSMRKIVLILDILFVLLCGCSCSCSYDGSDTASKDTKIGADFTQIDGEDNLYYCNRTKIVYWIGGSYMVNNMGDDYTTSYMTAYYSPNGKLYTYDVAHKQLVEIK